MSDLNMKTARQLTTDGGTAFPVKIDLPEGGCLISPGMSLRDWLAGQALNGLLEVCQNDTLDGRPFFQHVAKLSYRMADEMLAARGAGQ